MRYLTLSILSLSLFACTKATERAPSSSPLDPPLLAGESWGPELDEATKYIVESSVSTAKKNASGIVRRDAHPKHHGCIKAFWSTKGSLLEPALKKGVLADNANYEAWIRFSNGDPKGAEADDDVKDVRGFALKLMNVPNTSNGSQDFVTMNSDKFFCKDGEDYLDLHKALESGGLALVAYLASHPKNALIINNARVRIENPLSTTFFSPVPFRLGNGSMRFKFAPCDSPQPAKIDRKEKNYLRSALEQSLKSSPACFHFYVQENREPEKNLVEDPRLAWDETKSPWVQAATISIPAQSGFTSDAMLAFCENISFNPWNSQAEIRPMGQINRMRKAVYDAVSKFRHEQNKTLQAEPVNHQPCDTASTKALCATR